MGRPTVKNARPAGASRRDFFKRGGAAVALAAVPLLPAQARRPGDAPEASMFQHGVASGDPLSDRVILWTRITAAADATVVVRYVVATDPGLRHVVRRGRVRTDADVDHTVKVDVDGLRPGTSYYYRFQVARLLRDKGDRGRDRGDDDGDGDDRWASGDHDRRGGTPRELSPIGRTRTLPVGRTARLRIAVASCSSLAHGYFNAYRRIAERADLDLVVHLGDYLYEYATGQYGNLRAYEPATEIVTLSDYRTRHAQYKRDPDLQELHRQHPMVAIWDDHEITNDAWRDGAENHTEGAEGQWPGRVAMGLKAYYEWMPVRVVDPDNLRKNNRSFQLGDLVELVMLEERLNARSRQLGTINVGGSSGFVQQGPYLDPARELLGSEQERWLASRLRTSEARWKLVGQGVMFAQLKLQPGANAAGGGFFLNPDQWDGYQPARDRIFEIFKGNASAAPVDNVVVLTGDIHSSWAADLTQDPNNPDTANGGYDPVTGTGSQAVEFVATSITSPGVDDPTGQTAGFLRLVNPHFKYIDLNRRGYMLLDVDANRVVCEWWYVDTVAMPSKLETFGVAMQVQSGSRRVAPSGQSLPRPTAPPLAP